MNWARLSQEFGSPMYVYDLESLRESASALMAELPEQASLLYSLKANPHPVLVEELRRVGCGAEVSSLEELSTALQAGMDARDILYTGPGKSLNELVRAVQRGGRMFSVDSVNQLELAQCAARAERTSIRVVLRVNPERGVGRRGLAMTGVASQFGIDSEMLSTLTGQLSSTDECEIVGLHYYLGSNIAEIEDLADQFASSLRLSARLCEELNLEPEVINLGGGFAHPYGKRGERPSLSGLRGLIERTLDETFHAWRRGRPHLMFESGRFLVAGCGTLLARVVDVKESKGKSFVILDSGINHLGGMYGLGRLPRLDVEVAAADPDRESADIVDGKADIVGPLCTPLDYWARGREISLARGDLVVVHNVGAYGLTASLPAFLGRECPAEVVVDGGGVRDASRMVWHRATLASETPALGDTAT